MKRSEGAMNGNEYPMERSLGIPAVLLVLLLLSASCGGGGGDSTPLPAVQTDNASLVAVSVATLNGTLDPNGLEADAWFEYGTHPTLAAYDNTPFQHFAAGSGTQPVSRALTGLTPGTTYYFRLVASSAAGFREGQILSFTTHNPPPQVATSPATAITLDGATLNASVNPNGAATEAWFEYGDDPTLSVFVATDNQNLGSGRTPVAMDAQVNGLQSGTTYYYRAVAVSVEGEVMGQIQSFDVSFPPPAATTNNAANITTTGATFQGVVNPNGFSTEAYFEYGTDPTLAVFAETTHQAQGAGTADLPISASVGSLVPYRNYYFRAVARSTTDNAVFTKGAIRTFPTGEYYVAVGDSITFAGTHDDIPGDGIGFEPILGNLLAGSKGYPNTVENRGVSGATSADGALAIIATLQARPDAKYFLILYGTNDAEVPAIPSGLGLSPGDPGYSGSYKANMQAIITAIKNAGKVPYLAKVPYIDATNPSFPVGRNYSDSALQNYNSVIDELRTSNGVSVVAPNYYSWFQSHLGELEDGIHPNGVGFQSMAALWFAVLP